MKNLLFFILTIGSSVLGFSQAPGGVSTNLFLWLKADIGVSRTGSNVSQWTNQAGTPMTHQASKTATANVTYNSNYFNYNPSILFDGTLSQNLSGTYTSAPTSAPVLFCVSKSVNTQNGCCSGPYHLGPAGSYGIGYGEVWTGSTVLSPNNSYSVDASGCAGSNSTSATVNLPFVVTGKYVSATNLLNATSSTNGTIGPLAGSCSIFAPNGDFQVGGRTYGANNSSRIFNGHIPEVIHYNSPTMSALNISKIETYLAVKYGITLINNYVSTTGATIYTVSGGYENNIIGIGRDDNEALIQKQSHTLEDTVRIYLSTLAASNATNSGTFTNNNSYVVMGGDQGKMYSTLASNTEIPTGFGIYSRLEREWKVTKTNITQDFNCDIKLNSGASPTMINTAHLRLLVDDDGDFSNGGTTCYFNGDIFGTVISYSNPVITVSGISTSHIANNSTRYITIASIDAATPLPIELLNFRANTISNQEVELNWQTVSEINNDYFTIERSKNGIDWTEVTTVNGSGNSSTLLTYNSIDREPYLGISYYRLNQTDFDGQYSYSEIRSVKIEGLGNPLIVLYPNPVENKISIEADDQELSVVIVFNVLGQDVTNLSKQFTHNDSKLIIDLSNLSTGMYYIKTKTTANKVYKK